MKKDFYLSIQSELNFLLKVTVLMIILLTGVISREKERSIYSKTKNLISPVGSSSNLKADPAKPVFTSHSEIQ
jgi:hypothetical protein